MDFNIFKNFASKASKAVAEKTRLIRPLGRQEKDNLYKLINFLDKSELKQVAMLMKLDKINIEIKKLGYSFMISGRDLLPVLISEDALADQLNRKMEQKHYEQLFNEFKERAWTILPYYLASDTPGLLTEKRAVLLHLFTDYPMNVLLVGDGKDVVESAQDFKNCEHIKWQKTKPKSADFHLIFNAKKTNLKKFSDLFDTVVLESTTKTNAEDIRLIKEYIKEALKINVTIPRGLDQKIKTYVVGLKKKSMKTAECVIELVKASARMELRNKVEHKDLERAFSVVKCATNI